MDALTATGRSLVHFAAKEAEREEVTFFIKMAFSLVGLYCPLVQVNSCGVEYHF